MCQEVCRGTCTTLQQGVSLYIQLRAACSCLQGVENLFERQDRMASYGPTFCDITWGAGGSTAELTLEIADKMQNMVRRAVLHSCRRTAALCAASDEYKAVQVCVETMMHLTCTNMPAAKLDEALGKVPPVLCDAGLLLDMSSN